MLGRLVVGRIGGAGRFLGRSADIALKIVFNEGADISSRDVPFLRDVLLEKSDWMDRDRYFRFRERVLEASEAVDVGVDAREKVKDETKRLAGLRGHLKIAEKRRLADRKKITALNVNTRINDERRRTALDKIYKRQLKVMLAFNKRFVRTMGPQGE